MSNKLYVLKYGLYLLNHLLTEKDKKICEVCIWFDCGGCGNRGDSPIPENCPLIINPVITQPEKIEYEIERIEMKSEI